MHAHLTHTHAPGTAAPAEETVGGGGASVRRLVERRPPRQRRGRRWTRRHDGAERRRLAARRRPDGVPITQVSSHVVRSYTEVHWCGQNPVMHCSHVWVNQQSQRNDHQHGYATQDATSVQRHVQQWVHSAPLSREKKQRRRSHQFAQDTNKK